MKTGSKNRYDVIIAGSGAAGLCACITILRENNKKSVLLIDGNEKAGKKLALTGNGKCNFTNEALSLEQYHSEDKSLVAKIIESFSCEDSIGFFESLGIAAFSRNGYIYPLSGEARSFRDILFEECVRRGADFLGKTSVTEIVRITEEQSGPRFSVKTSEGEYFCRSLILATGGEAAPSTGSRGDGYRLAESLGLILTQPRCALVPLTLGKPYKKELAGIRARASVSIIKDKKVIDSDTGEIQFNKDGVSGIPVLNISSAASQLLAEGKDISLRLCLNPEGPEIVSFLRKNCSEKTLDGALTGIICYKAIPAFAGFASLDIKRRVSELSDDELNRLSAVISGMEFPVIKTEGFERAQVTAGGIRLSVIDCATLEAHKVTGLFPVGELLDCDGRCGGYNLHFAFATGRLAGKNIAGE